MTIFTSQKRELLTSFNGDRESHHLNECLLFFMNVREGDKDYVGVSELF